MRAYFLPWIKESVLTNKVSVLKGQVHGSAHAHLSKYCFFCCDRLCHLCKQHDHVIMMSKNQSAHTPGSHLINLCANNCKLIEHGIKPSGQQ